MIYYILQMITMNIFVLAFGQLLGLSYHFWLLVKKQLLKTLKEWQGGLYSRRRHTHCSGGGTAFNFEYNKERWEFLTKE